VAVRQVYGGQFLVRTVSSVDDLLFGIVVLPLILLTLLVTAVVAGVPPVRRGWLRVLRRMVYGAAIARRYQLTLLLGADLPALRSAAELGITGRLRRDMASVTAVTLAALLSGIVVIDAWALGASLLQLAVFSWLESPGRPTTSGLLTPIVAYGGLAAVIVFTPLLALAFAELGVKLARMLLGPTDQALLSARVAELTLSRAGVVEAVDAERRRIERDLHDGVQQRLVALGMLVGRARRAAARNPDNADQLLRQAHDAAQQALVELRDVSWTIYPAILDDRGLDAALSSLASRAGAPVRVDYRLDGRLPARLETAAYFVVSEAVTNAVKHAGAALVEVTVTALVDTTLVVIRDDGCGGANPEGSGLRGLAQRVAAVDGTFRLASPPGGPTIITVELPYAPPPTDPIEPVEKAED
jgi:signal transduction histidine kinase